MIDEAAAVNGMKAEETVIVVIAEIEEIMIGTGEVETGITTEAGQGVEVAVMIAVAVMIMTEGGMTDVAMMTVVTTEMNRNLVLKDISKENITRKQIVSRKCIYFSVVPYSSGVLNEDAARVLSCAG